jgi:hypothetical protein
MATFADDNKRLWDLAQLYEEGKFSECIEQGERILWDYAGTPPYWHIKIYCILVGANEDWHKAEVRRALRSGKRHTNEM